MDMVMDSSTFQKEYKPISAKGYLGYQLLFAIPIAGFVIALLLSFTARNRNVRSFARAEILAFIIVFILCFIAGMMGMPLE